MKGSGAGQSSAVCGKSDGHRAGCGSGAAPGSGTRGAFPGWKRLWLGWVGLGFPFFPELLCPSDPTAASHPGQEQLPRSPENNGG